MAVQQDDIATTMDGRRYVQQASIITPLQPHATAIISRLLCYFCYAENRQSDIE